MDASAGVWGGFFSIRRIFEELEEEMKLEIFDVSVKKNPQITLINPPKWSRAFVGLLHVMVAGRLIIKVIIQFLWPADGKRAEHRRPSYEGRPRQTSPDPPIRSQELFRGSWFLLWKCISGRAEWNGFCWFLGVIGWDGRLAANSSLPVLHRGSCILAPGFFIGLLLIILLAKRHNISFGKMSMSGYFLSLLLLIICMHIF